MTKETANLALDVIDDGAAFLRIRPEWDAFCEEAGCASPYLAPEWITSWWAGFGAGRRLRIHLVRRNGRLAAGAPLMISRRTLAGVPVSALHSIGINIAFANIPARGDDQEAFDLLLDGAMRESRSDILLFKGIPEGSASERLLRSFLEARGLRFTARPEEEIRLDTARGLEAYRSERRTKLWSNVRNRRKRLEALGRVEFERHRPARDPERVLADVCAVSMRSWKFRQGSAVALLEGFRRFFATLFASGIGDTWILRLDGEPIAYRVLAVSNGTAAEADIAFDERFRAYSPGTLLSAESNEAIVGEGCRDISLGLDFAWKEEWSPVHRRLLEFVVFREGVMARLAACAQSLLRRTA